MPLIAGVDCSGTPDFANVMQGRHLYVVCLAALDMPDTEAIHFLQAELDRVRVHLGLRQDQEFHGHEMTEEMMLVVLEIVLAAAVHLSILIIDKAKSAILFDSRNTPSPSEIHLGGILEVLTAFSRAMKQPLHTLYCDTDVSGKVRQQQAATAIRQQHRRLHPEAKLKIHFRASDTSALIQIADVVAYAVMSDVRNRIKNPVLTQLVRSLRQNPRHIVGGPMTWKKWEKE